MSSSIRTVWTIWRAVWRIRCPESLRAFGRDMEGNFKAVLQAQLAKLDLVTRQDFDVQAAILERTQAKLTALEARLKEIEAKLPT